MNLRQPRFSEQPRKPAVDKAAKENFLRLSRRSDREACQRGVFDECWPRMWPINSWVSVNRTLASTPKCPVQEANALVPRPLNLMTRIGLFDQSPNAECSIVSGLIARALHLYGAITSCASDALTAQKVKSGYTKKRANPT
jgi:hypothetical protein